jgi:hypothetical protein
LAGTEILHFFMNETLEFSRRAHKKIRRPEGSATMLNPLRSLDRWASQSGDRAALMLWLVVIAMALFVILSVAGLIWYTAP